MRISTRFLLALAVCALLAAQTTRVVLQQQVQLSEKSTPGWVLTVLADGVSLAPAAPPASSGRLFFGSPSAPGCVPQPTPGVYKLPVTPTSIAPYRNGNLASMPGEYLLNGNTLTFTSPIPGEVVICHYTF